MDSGARPAATLQHVGARRTDAGEVAQHYCYATECRACGHLSNIDLQRLLIKHGARYKIKRLQSRLICRCGSRDVTVQLMPWHFARRLLKLRH